MERKKEEQDEEKGEAKGEGEIWEIRGRRNLGDK
jgi:hypothetical protein